MTLDFNFYLKWVATAVLIGYTALTSLGLTPLNLWVGCISSLLWLLWSCRIKEWSLIVVNSVLLCIGVWGVITW